ncbi:MAG: hypothetical protein IKS55_15355 [Oscillospiraceae bacterium]|nr:hypothetical protein [Oscillospiraceae bacterium]
MKLTGKLKTQVESAATKEEKREAIKKAGILLTDDELDQVAGGREEHLGPPPMCQYDPTCIYVDTELCHPDLCPYIQAR